MNSTIRVGNLKENLTSNVNTSKPVNSKSKLVKTTQGSKHDNKNTNIFTNLNNKIEKNSISSLEFLTLTANQKEIARELTDKTKIKKTITKTKNLIKKQPINMTYSKDKKAKEQTVISINRSINININEQELGEEPPLISILNLEKKQSSINETPKQYNTLTETSSQTTRCVDQKSILTDVKAVFTNLISLIIILVSNSFCILTILRV